MQTEKKLTLLRLYIGRINMTTTGQANHACKFLGNTQATSGIHGDVLNFVSGRRKMKIRLVKSSYGENLVPRLGIRNLSTDFSLRLYAQGVGSGNSAQTLYTMHRKQIINQQFHLKTTQSIWFFFSRVQILIHFEIGKMLCTVYSFTLYFRYSKKIKEN